MPPKKYSPPYPLDTKGCCSPQNNPKKSSWLYCPRFQGISNDLFVDCTARFSCMLQKMLLFRQTVVTYWPSGSSFGRCSGDLSTFHPLDCFPVCCRLPVTIKF